MKITIVVNKTIKYDLELIKKTSLVMSEYIKNHKNITDVVIKWKTRTRVSVYSNVVDHQKEYSIDNKNKE
jgi:hypothetical protein